MNARQDRESVRLRSGSFWALIPADRCRPQAAKNKCVTTLDSRGAAKACSLGQGFLRASASGRSPRFAPGITFFLPRGEALAEDATQPVAVLVHSERRSETDHADDRSTIGLRFDDRGR